MKEIKTIISRILITALLIASMQGMVVYADEEPEEPGFTIVVPTEAETPKYYATISESIAYFKDRYGEEQYRIFGIASPSETEKRWYECDESGSSISVEPIATLSEYNNIAPIEYKIYDLNNYEDNIWSSFFSTYPLYASQSEFREEYSTEQIADYSSEYMEYEDGYDPFGVYAVKNGSDIVGYYAYGRILNGNGDSSDGWIDFTDYSGIIRYVLILKYQNGEYIGYSDGMIKSFPKGTADYTVTAEDIPGYKTPESAVIESDMQKAEFTYNPITYTIKNKNSKSIADDKLELTEFSYDEEFKPVETSSEHEGYILKAYKFKQ